MARKRRVLTLQVYLSAGNVKPMKRALKEFMQELAEGDTPLFNDPHFAWDLKDNDEA